MPKSLKEIREEPDNNNNSESLGQRIVDTIKTISTGLHLPMPTEEPLSDVAFPLPPEPQEQPYEPPVADDEG